MTTTGPEAVSDIRTKQSRSPVGETVERFVSMLREKGVKVFAVIDQAAEAREAGLGLRETVLVVFGNPAAGTPLMVAEPLSALDLPLKILVWDDAGRANVSYYSPESIIRRHSLPPELTANLRAVDALTDALVAPDTGA